MGCGRTVLAFFALFVAVSDWCVCLVVGGVCVVVCVVVGAVVDAGYGGVACSECLPRYYRLEGECAPCPKSAYTLIVAFAVAAGASRARRARAAAG